MDGLLSKFFCVSFEILKNLCIFAVKRGVIMRRSTRTYSPLGLLITAEREALGVRVKDFCRLAGIGTGTYTNLLFGKMYTCRAVQRC